MNKTRLLWLLVAADVLLAFGSVGAEALFGWTLSPGLAEYARQRATRFPGVGDVIPLLLLLATCSTAFVAWVGLVAFWRHARGFYLFSCATWLLHILVIGPSVKPSVAAFFTTLNGIVGGVIIGLVYFSDLARRFEKRPAQEAVSSDARLGASRA